MLRFRDPDPGPFFYPGSRIILWCGSRIRNLFDPGSGMEIFGSGIYIPDPQHWAILMVSVLARQRFDADPDRTSFLWRSGSVSSFTHVGLKWIPTDPDPSLLVILRIIYSLHCRPAADDIHHARVQACSACPPLPGTCLSRWVGWPVNQLSCSVLCVENPNGSAEWVR